MQEIEFNELAGRIEGIARAVLLLAQMMERETDMDGLTLTSQWRESVPQQQAGAGIQDTARKTLHELAQALDDARTRHQESVAAARLADPALLAAVRSPGWPQSMAAIGARLERTELRLAALEGTAPGRPRTRLAPPAPTSAGHES